MNLPTNAPTPAQQHLIQAIAHVLEADTRIESAWLGGSFGRGTADAYSDIDVTVVAPDAAFDAALKAYATDLSGIADVVFRMVHGFGRVISAVTADWERFDLTFLKPQEFAGRPAAAVKPLFNRGTAAPAPIASEPYRPSPQRIEQLTNEFIRILGLWPVGFGRGEWLVGQTGIGLLRGLLIDLMLEQNALSPAERGGALHLNRLLTPEQRVALEALPVAAPNPQSLTFAQLAITRLFLPLAKEMTERTGATWPTRFEEVTRRHVKAKPGADIG